MTTCCSSAGPAGCRSTMRRRSAVGWRRWSTPVATSRPSGVPDSLEHGDLAADEIILGPMGPGRPRLVRRVDHPSVPVCRLAPAVRFAIGRGRGRTRLRLPRPVAGERLAHARGWASRDGPGADRPAAPPRRDVRGADPARPRATARRWSVWFRRHCGLSCRGDPPTHPRRRPVGRACARQGPRGARLARGRPAPRRDRGGRLEDRRPRHRLRAHAGGAARRERRRPHPVRFQPERPVAARGGADRAGNDHPGRARLARRPRPGAFRHSSDVAAGDVRRDRRRRAVGRPGRGARRARSAVDDRSRRRVAGRWTRTADRDRPDERTARARGGDEHRPAASDRPGRGPARHERRAHG